MIPQVYMLPQYNPVKLTMNKHTHIPTKQIPDRIVSCKSVCDLKYAYIQNVGEWIECYRGCKKTK